MYDHHALSAAILNGNQTCINFIFDQTIFQELNSPYDKRITFIMDSLKEIEKRFRLIFTIIIIHLFKL